LNDTESTATRFRTFWRGLWSLSYKTAAQREWKAGDHHQRFFPSEVLYQKQDEGGQGIYSVSGLFLGVLTAFLLGLLG